jgi:hypothetical protein
VNFQRNGLLILKEHYLKERQINFEETLFERTSPCPALDNIKRDHNKQLPLKNVDNINRDHIKQLTLKNCKFIVFV